MSLFPGPEHAPKLGVPVSIEHLNVITSAGGKASVAWNVNEGVVSPVTPLGPLSIVACGAVESST